MQTAPIPDNDDERVKALRDYEMLAENPESWFDDIAKLVSDVCDTPIALLSLIDKDQQLFKATSGLPQHLRHAPRDTSFCGHAILEEEIFEITDTSKDERFADNPWVMGESHMRFYAGVPLINRDGYALGSLCAIGHEAKVLTDSQRESLKALGRVVMQHIETRRAETLSNHLANLLDTSDEFVAIVDARTLKLIHTNANLHSLVSLNIRCCEWDQVSATDIFPLLSEEYFKGIANDDRGHAAGHNGLSTLTVDIPSTLIASEDEQKGVVHLRITPSRVRDRAVLLLEASDLSSVIETIREKHAAREEANNLGMVARLTQNAVIIAGPEGKIEWVNPSFEEMTGYSVYEVIGERPGDLLQGEETDASARKRIASALGQGESSQEVILNYTKDGTPYWVDIEIQPVFDDEGKIKHFVSVQTDITKLKAMEAHQAEARREAEAASEAKTAFLANVSHELRTPLNGIMGIAEIIARNPERSDIAEQLGTLRNSANGLLELINRLLDFSQIEAQSMTITPAAFSLNEVLRNIDQMLRPEANRKGIRLSMSADINIPTTLQGDSFRLRQILTNLINNAIKFTESGEVRISIDLASSSQENVSLAFKVSDTGPGMPKSVQKQIFDPFGQADASIVRRHGGAGLGLAISQRLATLMGGSMDVESEVGKGATFTVSLPFDETSSVPESKKDSQSESSSQQLSVDRNARVLLIDDNELNRQVGIAMLGEMGVEATGADSGREGLEIFNAEKFDLILLDVQMPDMSGYDVIEQMHAINAEHNTWTPVAAVTAHSAASLESRIELFDDLIHKPLTFDGLKDRIAYWLSASELPPEENPDSVALAEDDSVSVEASDGAWLLDETLLWNNMGGDPNAVGTLIGLFERQHEDYLSSISSALREDDREGLANAAHKLKGAVGYFNQSGLWQSVAELEKRARDEEHAVVTDRASDIHERVLRLAKEVRKVGESA